MHEDLKAFRAPNISVGLAHAGAWFKSWDVHTAHILAANGNAELLTLATTILILSASGMVLVGVNVLIAAFATDNEQGHAIAALSFKVLFVTASALLIAGFFFCIETLLRL